MIWMSMGWFEGWRERRVLVGNGGGNFGISVLTTVLIPDKTLYKKDTT